MQIPRAAFELGLWTALAGVAAGATYLILVLVKEWRRNDLW